jgi:hypothetical protein
VIFSQEKTFTFTESEILGFTKQITDLQVKDSLNTKTIKDLESIMKLLEQNAQTDSLIIANKDLSIQVLKERSEILEKKVKLVKPSWYENKWLYFTYGVIMTVTSVNLAGQIVQ